MIPAGQLFARIVAQADEQRAAAAVSALDDARRLPLTPQTKRAIVRAARRLRAELEARDGDE